MTPYPHSPMQLHTQNVCIVEQLVALLHSVRTFPIATGAGATQLGAARTCFWKVGATGIAGKATMFGWAT